jgi:DNA-binding HxlR family transcriptional regulator
MDRPSTSGPEVRSARRRTRYSRLEPGGPNAFAITLGLLGDAWNLQIINQALWGASRYSEWMSQDQMSNSVLAPRLVKLTETGIFDRVAYQQRPMRHEYRLTARGRATWPILLTMWAWERQWAPNPESGLLPLVHTCCGHPLVPELSCAACGQPAVLRDISAREGPSGGWSRSVPAAATRRRSSEPGRSFELLPHTMELIGNRWSAALLGASMLGAHHYGEFVERLSAPPAIVADRLRTFCAEGVLEQAPDSVRPQLLTYHLTDKGRAFFPVVTCLIEWGQHWFRAPEGAAMYYRHNLCRRSFRSQLSCSQCGEQLYGRDIALAGPGLAQEPGDG